MNFVIVRLFGQTCLKKIQIVSPALSYSTAFNGSTYGRNSGGRDRDGKSNRNRGATLSLGAGALLLGGITASLKAEVDKKARTTSIELVGSRKEGLPEYTMQDVSKHDSEEKRIWVTYKNGVYDITDFIPKHPGADKIMMAAGGAVEPFWNVYAVHKKPEINYMLEDYRIGNLNLTDVEENASVVEDDPWVNEPRRHRALNAASKTPFNAETPLPVLADNFITPNELFYVRNHLPVPTLNEKDHVLEIELDGGDSEVTFTLDDIKTKFPKHTITATIQCGGNRRADMNKYKTVAGLSWEGGAIGNANWSGARLVDVLKAAGLKEGDPRVKHVQFEGADLGPDGLPYGASIPVEKGLNPWGDVILAYEMNGQPLPRDHGYPLRVIVPGNVAARSVKWLQRIVLSEEESGSHWQQKDYKTLSPTVVENPDYSKYTAIQSVPITSAICEPTSGSSLKVSKDGTIPVKGYAYSGGGNSVVRVEVSADGGKTWTEAKLERAPDAKNPPRNWSWVLWQARLPVLPGTKEVEIVSKAVDSSNNVQPESYSATWNLRGFLANAVSRSKINLQW